MSYTIYYSDPTRLNDPITVVDNTKNTQDTSLTLIGKNYPGFGQAIAENFVHLLENFASPTGNSPRQPIIGQLWYDKTESRLKVNSGGGDLWTPVNGVWQQDIEPNVSIGDLWVDTTNYQLKLYNGSEFVLVGPAISGTTKTGAYTETLLDTTSTNHTVIFEYIDDTKVAIFSKDTFTPNPLPFGFGQLSPGINLANNYILNGTAVVANNLQTSAGQVSGDNFLQKYIDQQMFATLSIGKDDNSLQLGSNSSFIIQRPSTSKYTANFLNTYSSSGTNSSGRFTFDVIVNSQNTTLLTIDGNTKSVSVGSKEKPADLNVYGKLNFLPTGTIMPYAGNSAPAGWLFCNGSTTSTLLYPTLSAMLVPTYGTGTSNTFVLPNLTNKLIPVNTTTSINYIIRT